MKNYEVTLSREATQTLHTTVSVNAETEERAIEEALSHAKAHVGEWSSNLGDKVTHGEISVSGVEEIVELEETA